MALITRLRPDVVHAHTPKAGLLGMLASVRLSVPFRVYQVHGLRYETSHAGLRFLLKNTERLACRSAHRVLCVSPSVREQLATDHIVGRSKTEVLAQGSACGVDSELYERKSHLQAGKELRSSLAVGTQLCVGYAGRLSHDKGLSELQAAWPRVAYAVPGAQLLIAGEEDETDPVDVSLLRERSDVHWLGRRKQMASFYAALDLFVLPSHREGLGQVALEASAMEVPVLGTEVTGLVDAVADQQTGVLVRPKDPDRLGEQMIRLLRDEDLRERLGRAGRAFVRECFEQSQVVAAFQEWYGSIP